MDSPRSLSFAQRALRKLALAAVLAAGLSGLPGCSSHNSSHHHNADGSYSYYRFHHDHTHQCNCRSTYHPSSHYYHAHY